MTGEEQARENGQAAMRKALAGLEEKYGPAKTNPDGTFEFDLGPQTKHEIPPVHLGSPVAPTVQTSSAPIVLPPEPRREPVLTPVLLVGILLAEVLQLAVLLLSR